MRHVAYGFDPSETRPHAVVRFLAKFMLLVWLLAECTALVIFNNRGRFLCGSSLTLRNQGCCSGNCTGVSWSVSLGACEFDHVDASFYDELQFPFLIVLYVVPAMIIGWVFSKMGCCYQPCACCGCYYEADYDDSGDEYKRCSFKLFTVSMLYLGLKIACWFAFEDLQDRTDAYDASLVCEGPLCDAVIGDYVEDENCGLSKVRSILMISLLVQILLELLEMYKCVSHSIFLRRRWESQKTMRWWNSLGRASQAEARRIAFLSGLLAAQGETNPECPMQRSLKQSVLFDPHVLEEVLSFLPTRDHMGSRSSIKSRSHTRRTSVYADEYEMVEMSENARSLRLPGSVDDHNDSNSGRVPGRRHRMSNHLWFLRDDDDDEDISGLEPSISDLILDDRHTAAGRNEEVDEKKAVVITMGATTSLGSLMNRETTDDRDQEEEEEEEKQNVRPNVSGAGMSASSSGAPVTQFGLPGLTFSSYNPTDIVVQVARESRQREEADAEIVRRITMERKDDGD